MTPAERDRILRHAEDMSVRGREAHWALIPPEFEPRLRPRVRRVGDGILTLLESSDSLQTNQTIGLGHRGQAKEAMIDEIIATYRSSKVARFKMLVSPGPQARAIAGWLRKRGFEPRGGHSMLVRSCALPVPATPSTLRVARTRRSDAAAIVAIHERCFGNPASWRPWSLAAMGSPVFEHYLAWDGATPVAAGSMLIDGELAWLGAAGTLTRWRRRGAHRALIAARLRRAARRGCRWAWVETLVPVPGRPAGSRRNLIWFGFEEVAVKMGWVHRARRLR